MSAGKGARFRSGAGLQLDQISPRTGNPYASREMGMPRGVLYIVTATSWPTKKWASLKICRSGSSEAGMSGTRVFRLTDGNCRQIHTPRVKITDALSPQATREGSNAG